MPDETDRAGGGSSTGMDRLRPRGGSGPGPVNSHFHTYAMFTSYAIDKLWCNLGYGIWDVGEFVGY